MNDKEKESRCLDHCEDPDCQDERCTRGREQCCNRREAADKEQE